MVTVKIFNRGVAAFSMVATCFKCQLELDFAQQDKLTAAVMVASLPTRRSLEAGLGEDLAGAGLLFDSMIGGLTLATM